VDLVGLLVAAWGFFCFIPYPALAVGNMSALQSGNVLTLFMCVPLAMVPWKGRPFWIYPLILAPLVISTLHVAFVGDADLGLALKGLPTYVVSCLALLVAQFYAPRYSLELLSGIAAATILHAAVGLWQLYAFDNGDFPLFRLYVNQSFLSVQASAGVIANYTKRPFGVFPEPSAMSSALAPFVLFWAAHMGGLVHLRREPAPWQRTLFGSAAVAGMALMIVSRSGHAAICVAAMVPLAIAWLVRCRATLRTFVVILTVFGVFLPLLLWFAGVALSDRLGGSEMGNSSWEERSTSLRVGFSLLLDRGVAPIVFGLGVGESAPALWSAAQIDAVFSVLLTYLYETGIFGLAAVVGLGLYVLNVWKGLRWSLPFAAVAFVWLVGVTITTSYTQLLPLWVALGWLTVWPQVCRTTVEGGK
jgi:hypothetical protein